MQAYIPSKEEFNESIRAAVEQAVTDRLPEIIRRATAKEYFTIAETCELLDCTRRHLQYLRDSRQIGYVKNGKKVYFKAGDIEDFFDRNYIEGEVR